MAQPGDGQQDPGQRPVPARVEAAGDHAQEQQGERQADRERELPGQGGRDVAPVDGERPVEEERHADHRQQGRSGEAHTGQAAEGPGGQREGDHAEDGDQLEGDAVGQHQVEEHDHQGGEREVEVVGGEAVVPVGGPPGDAPVGEQVVAHVVRAPHVGAGVTAGRRGVGEQQRRLELEEHEQHRRPDDAEGDDRLGGEPRQPGLEVLDHRRHGPRGANRRHVQSRHGEASCHPIARRPRPEMAARRAWGTSFSTPSPVGHHPLTQRPSSGGPT